MAHSLYRELMCGLRAKVRGPSITRNNDQNEPIGESCMLVNPNIMVNLRYSYSHTIFVLFGV